MRVGTTRGFMMALVAVFVVQSVGAESAFAETEGAHRPVEIVASANSRCVLVPGASPGDVAVLNITNTQAQGAGWGALRASNASPVYGRPASTQYSSVNFAAGAPPNPNLSMVQVGPDSSVCYDNGVAATNVILDLVALIPAAYVNAIDPARLLDTRDEPPPPTPLTFAPGQYLVGGQVPAGRYVMSAHSGCYWERQSGLGGSLGEVIANDFRSFTGRVIVDIDPTDVGFEFDSDCGSITTYLGSTALLTTISPGSHVVGEHIQPGTYVASAGDGCYWERLAGFGGTLDDVITNDFISTPGQQLVTILASDEGFYTDDECGTWSRL